MKQLLDDCFSALHKSLAHTVKDLTFQSSDFPDREKLFIEIRCVASRGNILNYLLLQPISMWWAYVFC